MKKTLEGFKKFILRGNAVDLAVGVVIGASFGAFVNAIVKDLLTPLIGAVAKIPDFSGLNFTLNDSKFMYGELINALASFLLVAGAVYFFVILPINSLVARTKRGEEIKITTKKCLECLGEIPIEAKRCAYCAQIVVSEVK
jgi:large conductance mechanosensitive channel